MTTELTLVNNTKQDQFLGWVFLKKMLVIYLKVEKSTKRQISVVSRHIIVAPINTILNHFRWIQDISNLKK